jgi:hypothetical protein
MTYNPEPEIEHYLKRLSKAAHGLPRGRRRELVAEIEQHIRDALVETPVDSEAEMLTLLDRIGAPDEIAAAAGDRPVTRSTAMETCAIILLLVGGFLGFVGWIVGVVLLWRSSVWTLRDKLIGTFVIPGGLATGLFALGFVFAGGVGAQVCSSSPAVPGSLTAGKPTTYAQVLRYAERGQLRNVVFQPAQQEIDATYQGKTLVVDAPTDQSMTQLQNVLARHSVPFDASGTEKETCTGGLSTLGAIALLLALATLVMAPIATSIYLGRRLERQKFAQRPEPAI